MIALPARAAIDPRRLPRGARRGPPRREHAARTTLRSTSTRARRALRGLRYRHERSACADPDRVNRAMNSPLSPRHYHVEFGTVRSWRPRSQVHLAGDLYVEEVGDRLRVRSGCRHRLRRDRVHGPVPRRRGDAALQAPAAPRIHAAHHGRPAGDLARALAARTRAFRELTEPASEPELVRRVTVWARRLGVPRHVFVTGAARTQAESTSTSEARS